MRLTTALLLALLAPLARAAPLEPRADPTVQLDSATVTGFRLGNTNNYLSIPFAKPPTGDRRFRLPEPIDPYSSDFDAKSIGPSCPQQAIDLPIVDGLVGEAIDWLVNTVYLAILPDSEDCLTINVVTPRNAKPGDKLPVAAWIFGGGFEIGGTQYYPGQTIVDKAIDLDTPVIYVSFNYRVTGFGFMPGQEIKDAGVGNLGLHDQREALRWIQKYISDFGGDPTKVTLFGESAGAISISLQMLANGGDTEGLFRAAYMMSGSPIPTGDIANGQVYYDDVVKSVGCEGAADTLQCLREVDYSSLKSAINKTPGIFAYQSLALAYLPRADGVFLTDDPQKLVAAGKIANIPVVNGDKDDEGTLFMLSTLNVTRDSELRQYMRTYWVPDASDDVLDDLMAAYPQDPALGSPYNTGNFNQLSPQSKRIASFIGDAVFQAPRRFFLDAISSKQPTWSYVDKRFKSLPFLGAAHGTDIVDMYAQSDMTEYFIQFCVSLDPNEGRAGLTNWPSYDTQKRDIMVFKNGIWSTRELGTDDFRRDALTTMTRVLADHPLR